MSLLNIAVLSTLLLLTFLLSDSDGPAAVDIHDVPIVPSATVISDVNCAPAVACNAAVLGSQTIAVILAVACCWRHCCIPAVAAIPAVAGVPLVPDVLIVAGLPAVVVSLCSLY